MTVRLYNSFTRQKEEFTPITAGEVRLYTCGPTVYDYAHIGNLRTFLFEDLLKRTLEYNGFKVTHVMNLTDVDDKTIKGAMDKGISLNDYTLPYKYAFFEDLDTLRIKKAGVYCNATEHIPEMVKLIKTLMEKGYAYKVEDGIYFNIEKFANYGFLSNFNIRELRPSERGQHLRKQARTNDFALWKAYKPEDGDAFWVTELGKGRPGWHIECSAMAMKHLGEHFDIHCGGIDNIFPHHENEIAQSEAATDVKFVNYWIHARHLLVNKQKMSKSKGNFYTLRDLTKQGYSPEAIRYLLMANALYRHPQNFTIQALKSAEVTVKKLNLFNRTLDEIIEANPNIQEDSMTAFDVEYASEMFDSYLNDDLNLPRALGEVMVSIGNINRRIHMLKGMNRNSAVQAKELLEKVNAILDILTPESVEIPQKVQVMVDRREEYRNKGRILTSDLIREEIIKKGYYVEDTDLGPRIRKLRTNETSPIILDVLEGLA